MEKRVSPLKVDDKLEKAPTAKKTAKAVKKPAVNEIAAEQKPVAKRVNPINLKPESKSEEPKVVEKIVEKVVERIVVKEVPTPIEPAMKVNGLKVERKTKIFFKLSKAIVNALQSKHPELPLNVNVENAILTGLKISDKDSYAEVEKQLKGE